MSARDAWGQAPPEKPAESAEAFETARGLATQAVKLYDEGDYALALELFQRADGLYPAPSYRVYVARAYAKLGKIRTSLAKYDTAIRWPRPAYAPPSFIEAQRSAELERPEIAKRLAILRIEITGALPEDVLLTVDGELVAPSSRAHVELDPGRHQIVVRAPGSVEREQAVELREGASSSLLVALEPRVAARRPAAPWRPLAIAAGALTVTGLGIAIVSGAVLANKRSSILHDCPNESCNTAGRALIDSVPPIDHVNLAGWIAAAVGGVATGVFVGLDLASSKRMTTLVPATVPGGAGAWVTTRF